jgi:hypothetical protein
MSNKLKKDDRAFLYFRENAKGALNIKFGPEKFSTDTQKFTEVLLTGNLHCMTFLSNLTKQEPMEFRMRQYDNMKLNYHAVLDQAFDDVFAEKKRIYELEELAIERVENGDAISPEFEEKIQEAKATIKERSTQKTPEKIEGQSERFKKEVEDRIQILEETKARFEELHPELEPGEEDEENFIMKQVINGLIEDEIEKLTNLYREIEEGKAIMV